MTARRQFMLCAQILKHIDADAPIRFLIAESEAPATVMGAIYLARLFGVEHRLDISPLFETPDAIERGGRLVERLLAEDEFVDYIRARGRIAVQLGFSDSGRFMGQVAANLAIERLQILVARALAARGVSDIEVVLFNTHGESMGRGGYPGDLEARFDYILTPWTRAAYKMRGLRINAESSFQGGDGFLHFQTDALAQTTINAILTWSFRRIEADKQDRFYADINYSWDFYRGIKHWQEELFDDPDYQVSIGAFAPNLLFTTGSRKVRRQAGSGVSIGPRSLRAIPHNAILQQLGAPANVFGGAGTTAGSEPDRLLDLVRGSARARQALGIIRDARAHTSLPAMRAYAAMFNATFWITRAGAASDPVVAKACEAIALHLAPLTVTTALNRFANHLAADLARLDRILLELDGADARRERYAGRRPLHALHAVRQAMIMHAFMLVAGLPAFSPRHDLSRSGILDYAMELRFDALADVLEEIFPAKRPSAAALSGVREEGDASEDAARGYPEIHTRVTAPLRAVHQSIREIGVGLAHFYGAYG
ncbi:MAG: phosphoenolpyruvate carboxylase [Amphiplicatus sp.]